MTRSLPRAAFVYFLIVFAVGFALGTVRTIWVAPAVGPLAATVLELPFMLAASWVVCGWCVRHFSIVAFHARAAMGALAFLFLMVAEAVLAVAMFGMRLSDYGSGFLTTAGVVGLTGQVAFAAMPLLQAKT